MERIQVFIDKLAAQQQKGESVDKLLVTVQLLQQELLKNMPTVSSAPPTKVAVVMPALFSMPAGENVNTVNAAPKTLFEIPESDRRFLPVDTVPDVKNNINDNAALKEKPAPSFETYSLRKPQVTTLATEQPKEVYQLDEPSFDEFPTLMQHVQREKELHEVIAPSKLSLNDQLKAGVAEVAHKLSEAPIKDLRKGIGLNDKFVFTNELFRGDEVMYERSIKTINSFNALPEAEYWMNRELKVKLGWNDSHEAVQHFYAVVRRRFS